MVSRKRWIRLARDNADNKTPMKTSIALIAFLTLFLVACGAASPTQTPGTLPTPFPTYAFVPPTIPPAIASLAASSTLAATVETLDPQKITLGMGRYVALKCGDCHGDAGQGTSNGSPLAGTKLSQDDFINFLRTGGTVGSSHLYSTNRLSETGGENIYLYVLSLAGGK